MQAPRPGSLRDDSVLVMQMTNQLETVFGSLPKTLFFEYQNILELTEYFIAHHADKLGTLLGKDQLRQAPLPAVPRDPLELSSGSTAYVKKSSYKKNGLLPQPNRPGRFGHCHYRFVGPIPPSRYPAKILE